MEFSANQICQMLDGKIEGDADVIVSKLSKIEEGEPGSISFLANPVYTKYIYTTNASIVIVNEDFNQEKAINSTLIRVKSAEIAFAKLLELYNEIKMNKSGISEKASVSTSAKLGDEIYVGDFVFIGDNVEIGNNVKIYPQVYLGDNVKVGDNTVIYAGVNIYSDCVVGRNCIIHSGNVIGSDGFRFATENPDEKKVPQIGNVIIEDDVEIGANCAIDRATLGSTILRKGVKFDNLIHIAHNVEIGENTFVAAGVIIAGSTKIGKNCMFSGQVGIVGHLNIADNTIIAAQAGISKNIRKPGQIFLGSPAFEISEFRKSYVHFKNLPDLVERIDELERKMKEE